MGLYCDYGLFLHGPATADANVMTFNLSNAFTFTLYVKCVRYLQSEGSGHRI